MWAKVDEQRVGAGNGHVFCFSPGEKGGLRKVSEASYRLLRSLFILLQIAHSSPAFKLTVIA